MLSTVLATVLPLLLSSALFPWLQGLLTFLPFVGSVGALYGWWTSYRKHQREEKILQETEKEKQRDQVRKEEAKDQETAQFKAKVEDRMTGFNIALEKIADKANQDCQNLDKKIGGLQSLSTEVTKLQSTTDGTNTRVEKLETSLEKLENRLNTRLDNLEKKTDDNARWQNSVLNEILLHLNGGGGSRRTSTP